jgi:hypothetical protein
MKKADDDTGKVCEDVCDVVRIIFDRWGGVTLHLGNYGRYYEDAEQAARDYTAWLREGTAENLEDSEPEALELDPTPEEINNDTYRIFTAEEIEHEVSSEEYSGWDSIDTFCDNLKNARLDGGLYPEQGRDREATADQELLDRILGNESPEDFAGKSYQEIFDTLTDLNEELLREGNGLTAEELKEAAADIYDFNNMNTEE